MWRKACVSEFEFINASSCALGHMRLCRAAGDIYSGRDVVGSCLLGPVA